VVLWRTVLFRMKVQLCLHRLYPRSLWAAALQWYNVYFLGISVLLVYSFIELRVLRGSRKDIEDNLRLVWRSQNQTELASYYKRLKYPLHNAGEVSWEEFRSTFQVEPWLRNLNDVAVSTGPITLMLCVYHVYTFLVLPGHRDSLEREDRSALPWMPFRRVRYLLLIFILPTLYVASALRGNIRIWSLLTGNGEAHLTEPWEHVTMVAIEMYKTDMEVANFLQYVAVWSFAALCGLFISEHFLSFENHGLLSQSSSSELKSLKDELQMVIQWPAFIGVWGFIVVGLIQSASCFTVSEMMQHERYKDAAIKAQGALESVLKPILATFTILAVINMVMLSSVKIVRDKLGNANLKFNGTRILIIVGNIQSSVIAMFTKGSKLYEAALSNRAMLDAKVFSRLPFDFQISDFEFSLEKGYLLHVSLLLLECLLVVCMNILFWLDFDLHNVQHVGADEHSERNELFDEGKLNDELPNPDDSCPITAEENEFRLLKKEGGCCGSVVHLTTAERIAAEAPNSRESRQILLQDDGEPTAGSLTA